MLWDSFLFTKRLYYKSLGSNYHHCTQEFSQQPHISKQLARPCTFVTLIMAYGDGIVVVSVNTNGKSELLESWPMAAFDCCDTKSIVCHYSEVSHLHAFSTRIIQFANLSSLTLLVASSIYFCLKHTYKFVSCSLRTKCLQIRDELSRCVEAWGMHTLKVPICSE